MRMSDSPFIVQHKTW